MGLFNKKDELTSARVVVTETLDSNEHVAPTLEVCVPENLVSSDINLTNLSFGNLSTGHYGKQLENTSFKITTLYWLQQSKDFEDGGHKKIDKFLLRAKIGSKVLYFMSDVFYVPEQNLYVAKVLGTYQNPAKVLSANFKHRGELVAEKCIEASVPLTCIDSTVKFDKRALPLYFLMELNDFLDNI